MTSTPIAVFENLAGACALCAAMACHAPEAAAPHAPPAPPTSWNDTSIGGRYGRNFHFPGSPDQVAQKIIAVTTAGGFKYGSYWFNVDFLESDMNNPEANGSSGAREVYSVGHVEWSAGKITGQPVDFAIVRDVGLTTGYELSSKNDAFGSAARMLTLGATLELAVPHGFWDVTVGARTEDNHNGVARTDVHYSTAWHVESGWMVPFHLGPVHMVYKGFAAVTGPKGKDGFQVETVTEVLTRMSVLLDVGALVGHPRTVYLGPGYEYWHNMFGTPSSEAPGTERSAAVLVGEIHF